MPGRFLYDGAEKDIGGIVVVPLLPRRELHEDVEHDDGDQDVQDPRQQARLTRGQVLSVREKEYVEASRALGAPSAHIIFRHVLPNILGPLIVLETLAIPGYIYTEAFLSFIGLGVNPPTPSWGSMIADGSRALRSYPNQVLVPALSLAITMFAFNFLGDGLRDALEPRLRGTQE